MSRDTSKHVHTFFHSIFGMRFEGEYRASSYIFLKLCQLPAELSELSNEWCHWSVSFIAKFEVELKLFQFSFSCNLRKYLHTRQVSHSNF